MIDGGGGGEHWRADDRHQLFRERHDRSAGRGLGYDQWPVFRHRRILGLAQCRANHQRPALTITPASPGSATISWTPNTPGFVLQDTLSLWPTNWVNSVSGTTNPIVVPATLPTKFYRLFKP